MDGGCNLKPELQLATDMLCRKPPTQSVADHSITMTKNPTNKHLKISISTHQHNKSYFKTPQKSVLYFLSTYPIACFSSNLCTGMDSLPKKRFMMGRLLANLSFTSISNTSVGRDTKLKRYKQEIQRHRGRNSNHYKQTL